MRSVIGQKTTRETAVQAVKKLLQTIPKTSEDIRKGHLLGQCVVKYDGSKLDDSDCSKELVEIETVLSDMVSSVERFTEYNPSKKESAEEEDLRRQAIYAKESEKSFNEINLSYSTSLERGSPQRSEDSVCSSVNEESYKNEVQILRMIDREIGGLLAHPKSTYVDIFREIEKVLFPGGLELGTKIGSDVILLLNKDIQYLTETIREKQHSGSGRRVTCRVNLGATLDKLKNPERRVAQIIGAELAQELFSVRGKVLEELVKREEAWQENLAANKLAQEVLVYYGPVLQLELLLDRTSKELEKSSRTPRHKGHALNLINSIDSMMIALLLQHPKSPMSYAIPGIILPATPSGGKDFLTLHDPKKYINPEECIRMVGGEELAARSFAVRGNVLGVLAREGRGWVENFYKNQEASCAIFNASTLAQISRIKIVDGKDASFVENYFSREGQPRRGVALQQ